MKDIEKKTRQENRRIAFENFKRKHYLNDCYFFCQTWAGHYRNTARELIITRDADIVEDLRKQRGIHEVSAPHTLVKFVKMVQMGECKLAIYDNKNHYKCDTLDELKENILVLRLITFSLI